MSNIIFQKHTYSICQITFHGIICDYDSHMVCGFFKLLGLALLFPDIGIFYNYSLHASYASEFL